MNVEKIKVGKKVIYHPILNDKDGEEAVITHGVFEVCGTLCCMINIRSSCVAIENLEEI